MHPGSSQDSLSADLPSARAQVRGSALMLAGRGLALAINLAVQVATVRYLAKADFGAFAFAVSLVALGAQVCMLGLNKSLARFAAIYHEQGDYPRLVGSVALAFGTVLIASICCVATVLGLSRWAPAWLGGDVESIGLLCTLVLLAPIDALEYLLEALFAVFGNVRSVFLRRHLVGPGLKLLAVGFVIALGGDVYLLSRCYLAAGVIGLALYGFLMVGVLREQGLGRYFNPRVWCVPVGEIYRYSLPLFSSQVGFVFRTSAVVYLLELLNGRDGVAEFRAVFPFARLNEVVLTSFSFLYTPFASRLYVRGATEQINLLYWRSSAWIAVLALPAFLACVVLAPEFIGFVLGSEYASASSVLAILSTGFFLDAVLGCNVHTLRVFARVRQIVVIEVASILVGLFLNLALIPRWGALGAAVGVCSATVLQNALFQAVMIRETGIGVLRWPYARFYLQAAFGTGALGIIRWQWHPPLWIGLAVTAAVCTTIVVVNRELLAVGQTFPKLQRIPLVRRWLLTSSAQPVVGSKEGNL